MTTREDRLIDAMNAAILVIVLLANACGMLGVNG